MHIYPGTKWGFNYEDDPRVGLGRGHVDLNVLVDESIEIGQGRLTCQSSLLHHLADKVSSA